MFSLEIFVFPVYVFCAIFVSLGFCAFFSTALCWFCLLISSREIGWDECLRNYPFVVEWDVGPVFPQQINLPLI